MTVTTDVLITGPEQLQSQTHIRNYEWFIDYVADSPRNDGEWGEIHWWDTRNFIYNGNELAYPGPEVDPLTYDPDDLRYIVAYRIDGADSFQMVEVRPIGPWNRNMPCNENSPWYPYCTDNRIDILSLRGAMPHLTQAERQHISDNIAEWTTEAEGEGVYRCPVYHHASFAYFLFRDESLDNVCSPGGYVGVQTLAASDSEAFVNQHHKSYDSDSMQYPSYPVEDSYYFRLDSDAASGTNQVAVKMPWIPTSQDGLTGFYRDPSIMEIGGLVEISGTCGLDSQLIESVVGNVITFNGSLSCDFSENDRIRYTHSEHKQLYYIQHQGMPVGSDGVEGQTSTFLSAEGGLGTTATVESFEPIPWAIPAPYSIRNVPYTDVWQRLQQPVAGFNLSSLVYKINDVSIPTEIVGSFGDRAGIVQVLVVPGGVELLYDPVVNFTVNSRVYVDISISCSPSLARWIDHPTTSGTYLAGSEYIRLTSSGSQSALYTFQAGGQLNIGPNPAGEWEINTIKAIVSNTEIMVDPTQYEYPDGTPVLYTYDDYPVEISYWFDIVNDFTPPVFENIYPFDGMADVSVLQAISFDIKDQGLGVDISTLTFTVNNLVVIPQQIIKYSDNWYRVAYTPEYPYYFNAMVECFATIADLSTEQNRAYATWAFSTGNAELPFVVNPDPSYCAFPVHHNSDIRFDVYGKEGGINEKSIIVSIDDTERNVIKYPKIYRWS